MKFTAVVVPPLHNVWSGIELVLVIGCGFTVKLKLPGVPVQPLLVGVTVMVAVTGLDAVLVIVKGLILPVPIGARLMKLLLLVQLYVAPLTAPVKFTAVVVAMWHSVWLDTGSTVGVGFTVIVNDVGVPGQPAFTGVTVMVAVTGA